MAKYELPHICARCRCLINGMTSGCIVLHIVFGEKFQFYVPTNMKYQVIHEIRRWSGEGEERVNKGFGAQRLLGVWQSRERRRAQWVCWNYCIRKLPLGEAESSLAQTGLFVNSRCCQTSYLSESHPVRGFRACSDSLAAQQLQQNVSVLHDPKVKWH